MRIFGLRRRFIVPIVAAAVATMFVSPILTLAILLTLLAIFYLSRNLGFGLIILVFFFPYMGLVIDFSQFDFLQNTPFIKQINAPFVDLYGLVLFVAWAIVVILRYFRGSTPSVMRTLGVTNNQSTLSDVQAAAQHSVLKIFPFWKSYGLFWLSGLVSLWKVPSLYFYSSLKYFVRPFTFCYLVFFAMPISILNNLSTYSERSERNLLHRVLWVFFATGLIAAIDGFLGFVFGTGSEFPRAMPFGFWGVNPLGPNHNLLAETLIATAPAGLILMNQESGIRNQGLRWIAWVMWFQWFVALLTFSRTAWIAVAAQAIIYIALVHRKKLREFLKGAAPAIILLSAMAIILVSTIFSETVRGSTLSRWDQVRIAEFYFERSPIIGQGIGTFIPTLWQTKAFLLEYGEPLDAHGVLFKLMFEQGLLGLIGFGVFVGAVLTVIYRTYRSNKTDRTNQIVLIAALLIAAGSLIYQLFNTTYYSSKLWVPLAIAVAITKLYEIKKENLGVA